MRLWIDLEFARGNMGGNEQFYGGLGMQIRLYTTIEPPCNFHEITIIMLNSMKSQPLSHH